MRKLGVIHLAAGLLALTVASATWAQDRPRIVAVNYALATFAERLAGDAAEVVFPVPEDTDPSFWRPAIADISQIQSADLILLNGAFFAAWVDRVSLPRSKLVNTSQAFSNRYILTESITHSHGDGGEHSHEGTASYVWLDPELATLQAEAIAAALTRKRLVPEADVGARLVELRADLAALDTAAQEGLSGAGPIIATHPRYQYLARAFGLSIASLEWEAGAAPTDEDLQDLAGLAAETGAKVLIWEAEPPAGAQDAVAELGLTSVTLPPLAQRPADGAFFEVLGSQLSALAKALSEVSN